MTTHRLHRPKVGQPIACTCGAMFESADSAFAHSAAKAEEEYRLTLALRRPRGWNGQKDD